jgi:hypothetical protein
VTRSSLVVVVVVVCSTWYDLHPEKAWCKWLSIRDMDEDPRVRQGLAPVSSDRWRTVTDGRGRLQSTGFSVSLTVSDAHAC